MKKSVVAESAQLEAAGSEEGEGGVVEVVEVEALEMMPAEAVDTSAAVGLDSEAESP